MKMIFRSWRLHYAAATSVFLIVLTMVALIIGMVGCGNTPASGVEIRDWHDLDAVRKNLGGKFLLMNNLDSNTAGYTELASPTANGGKGWQPIGIWPNPFTGSFDGQGFEIRDLFIDRPGEDTVGLFSFVNTGATIVGIALMDADVTGELYVGGLVGHSRGNLSNCHSTGSVVGYTYVGGLIGENGGTVSNSYSTAIVNGSSEVGGLIGQNHGTVSKSYSTGSATGDSYVGGLVGWNHEGSVDNSYSSARVDGELLVGGLTGHNRASVSYCYSTGNVTGYEDVGGLVGRNYEGTVSNSFWDTQTSGQATSDGGTGRNTTEMRSIAPFSGATWNIGTVANPSMRDTSYVWNIVQNMTYPFLAWQMVV
jgi:The GLUG motif